MKSADGAAEDGAAIGPRLIGSYPGSGISGRIRNRRDAFLEIGGDERTFHRVFDKTDIDPEEQWQGMSRDVIRSLGRAAGIKQLVWIALAFE